MEDLQAIQPKRGRGRPSSKITSVNSEGVEVTTSTKTIIKDDLIAPYNIRCDEDCYVVLVPPTQEGGMANVIGYYTKFGSALRKLAKLKGPKGEVTIKEYISKFEENLKQFDILWERIG